LPKGRQDNGEKKKENEIKKEKKETMVNKILHIKLKIEQYELH